jgi:hypothetical protein
MKRSIRDVRVRVVLRSVFVVAALVIALTVACAPTGGAGRDRPQTSFTSSSNVPSPTPTLNAVEQWVEDSRWIAGYGPDASKLVRAPGVLERERLPIPTLYRILYTEGPLLYDEAARTVRQRDPQAKFAAMRIYVIGHEPTEELVRASIFFYSPIDDVLLEYVKWFSRQNVNEKIALEPRSADPRDGFEYAQDKAQAAGRAMPDFPKVTGLREPWARYNVEAGLYTAWSLAGKPPIAELVIMFSARAPYDFGVDLYPVAESISASAAKGVHIIVSGVNYYRASR